MNVYKDAYHAIRENGFYAAHPRGTSMQPFIWAGRDTVIIEKAQTRLKKYDVALYRRGDGTLVLHRVVGVRKNGYVFCGDNHSVYEYNITDDDVLGVMTALYHDGEETDINAPSYKRRIRKHYVKTSVRNAAHRLLDRVRKKQ